MHTSTGPGFAGPFLSSIRRAPDEGGSGGGGGAGTLGGGGAPPTNAGASSTGSTGGSGGGFTPPPGMRMVPEKDWSERDSFYSKAREHGFNDADTLGKYAPLHKTFTERKMDPAQFASILAGQQQQRPQAEGGEVPLTRAELDKMFSEREARSRAEAEWDGHQRSYPGLVQNKLKELKADGPVAELLAAQIEKDILSARRAAKWEDGHPLADSRLPAVTPEMVDQVFASGKYGDKIKALRGYFLSSAAAENGSVQPTVAGATGQPGATHDKAAAEEARKRGVDPRSREQKIEQVRQMVGSRGAGSGSAALA